MSPLLLVTVASALLTGFTGGWLLRGRARSKRVHLPNGSALQRQPEAVWGKWTPQVGQGLRR
jgi:hypothetical protein